MILIRDGKRVPARLDNGMRVFVMPNRTWCTHIPEEEAELRHYFRKWQDGDDNPFGMPVVGDGE